MLITNETNFYYKFIILTLILTLLISFPIQSKHQSVPALSPKEQQHIIKETQCLKEALHFESSGEPLKGKVAVLEVIHNRKISKKYPDSYCGVIQQSRQFSYRNHLKKGQGMTIKRPINALERRVATDVSTLSFKAATGRLKPSLPPSVLWYHVASMKKKPQWAQANKFCEKCKLKSKNPTRYATIGSHLFYRS